MSSREDRIRALAAQTHGVVTAEQCLGVGLTHSEVGALCASGAWRRLCRGAYLPDAHLHDQSSIRRAEIAAALIALGPGAVAVRETAAELLGLAGLPGELRAIHVSVPPGSARDHRGDTQVHECVLPPEHVVSVAGLRLTSPLRTVADLLRCLSRASAVSVADSAMNLQLIGPNEVAALAPLMRRRRGAARGRARIHLIDGRAASPLETRVRLICLDAGLPPDELQYPIYDRHGTLLAVADMAWKQRRLVVEADGVEPHERPEALLRDRRRQNDLVNDGWAVLRFTWADTQRPSYIASAIRSALRRSVA